MVTAIFIFVIQQVKYVDSQPLMLMSVILEMTERMYITPLPKYPLWSRIFSAFQ